MTEPHFDIQEVARLIDLVETRGLTCLRYEHGECAIEVKSDPTHPAMSSIAHLPTIIRSAPPIGGPSDELIPAVSLPDDRIKVEAPMLGIFYRAPSPDQPNFVESGDHVEVGQTIGIIEAMKVFSEVPSEVTGTVIEVIARNGQLVHPGDALMYLGS